MKRIVATLFSIALVSLFALPSIAQTQEQPVDEPATVGTPEASDGGRVQTLPPRPVPEADDPVNRLVAATTVDGIVVAVTIDGPTVTLDAAAPARVPRRVTRQRRETGADTVRFTALSNGQVVATTVVPDNVINAHEEQGLVRVTRRQIVAALAIDRPVDTVRVEAPATGATGTLDVRAAWARICEADPSSRWCPRPAATAP
jgi:hypothetical protein